ncbi:major facilitator superfamily domain-containing protein [Xylariaceae sp. FL1272]|nr:major facilitator superfamily domain-containing protein [Xylariaceae sp. FL1272]
MWAESSETKAAVPSVDGRADSQTGGKELDTSRASSITSSGSGTEVEQPRAEESEQEPKNITTPKELKEGDELGEYVEGWKLWSLLLSTSLTFFLVLLDSSILSTAIPQITTEFHALADQGWYTGAYQLSSSVLQPISGKIYTYFNTKWTYLAFFIVFEIGSLLCGVATSSTFFIIGRAIAGIGVSGLQNGALSIIAGAVPLQKRPFYLGLLIGIGQLGIVLGPLIGGALTDYVSWRWCFYINLPVGGVAFFLMTFIHAPEQIVKAPFSMAYARRILPKFDLFGFALFAPFAIMLLLALQFGTEQKYAWDSSVNIGLFAGSGVSLILFVLWEWHTGDNAIIPFSMLKNRIVWGSTMFYWTLIASIFVGTQYIPIYFQSVKGATPILSGVYLLPSILSQLFFLISSGILIQRVGYYLPFAVIAGAGAVIASALLSTLQPGSSTGEWVGYQIIFGLRGCGVQVAVIAIQNALPPAQSQIGLAFTVFCQNFAAAVFVVVGNTIFTQGLTEQVTRLVTPLDPRITPAAVLAAGSSAKGIRDLFPNGGEGLDALLQAYSNAFDLICYLMVALASISFIFAFFSGWVNLKKKEAGENEVEKAQMKEETAETLVRIRTPA